MAIAEPIAPAPRMTTLAILCPRPGRSPPSLHERREAVPVMKCRPQILDFRIHTVKHHLNSCEQQSPAFVANFRLTRQKVSLSWVFRTGPRVIESLTMLRNTAICFLSLLRS